MKNRYGDLFSVLLITSFSCLYSTDSTQKTKPNDTKQLGTLTLSQALQNLSKLPVPWKLLVMIEQIEKKYGKKDDIIIS